MGTPKRKEPGPIIERSAGTVSSFHELHRSASQGLPTGKTALSVERAPVMSKKSHVGEGFVAIPMEHAAIDQCFSVVVLDTAACVKSLNDLIAYSHDIVWNIFLTD